MPTAVAVSIAELPKERGAFFVAAKPLVQDVLRALGGSISNNTQGWDAVAKHFNSDRDTVVNFLVQCRAVGLITRKNDIYKSTENARRRHARDLRENCRVVKITDPPEPVSEPEPRPRPQKRPP